VRHVTSAETYTKHDLYRFMITSNHHVELPDDVAVLQALCI
jgi:hypothetical protein